MQSRHRRRYRPTPIVDRRNEHVWARALTAMGLQPLNANRKSATSKDEDASAAIHAPVTPEPGSSAEGKKKITILDLPFETQKAIFQHSSPSDLLSLALVSRHFRDIAAEHLYRSFHIVFPTDDNPGNEVHPDALALGLETFTTSEYDYGRYVREFIVESTGGLVHTQEDYRDYLADTSCGKFLNTLLILTLRKTKALETFKWDIRVEPSRQVYQALQDLKALQHLHIRLHAGSSVYSPSLSNPTVITPANNNPNSFGPFPGQQTFTFSPINVLPSGISHPHPGPDAYPGGPNHHFQANNNLAYKSKYKQFRARLATATRPPPTLSGFKNLKTLAVLDMDSLDYVSELHRCLGKSWTTLRTLHLSFSEALSMKSKKPQPELHSDDDSDPDDDFTQLVPPPPGGVPPPVIPPSGPNDSPTKVIKAQEERKKQEAVLGQIFGIELSVPDPQPPPPPELIKKSAEDARIAFAKNLTPLGQLLLKIIKKEGDESELGRNALSVLTKASQAYIDSLTGKKEGEANASDEATASGKENTPGEEKEPASGEKTTGSPPAAIATAPDAAPAVAPDPPSQEGVEKTENETPERGLFDEPDTKEKPREERDSDVANPDDIDIEAPEAPDAPEADGAAPDDADEDADENARTAEVAPANEEKPTDAPQKPDGLQAELKTTESEFYKFYLVEKKRIQQLIEFALTERDSIRTTDAADRSKRAALLKAADAFISDLIQLEVQFKEKLGAKNTRHTLDEGAEKISEYVRKTRGLNLESLAIYLIPIKAGILVKAVNMHVLRSITLLEVGHQNLFWVMAAQLNSMSPLPLRKIYTDNVSLHFLAFVHALECVEELLLVERKPHSSVESVTPKTNVTIDQIRQTALRKHASTLKVLMIQNDDTPDWDLSTEAAILLCKRAKNLEELAVSFGTRTMHTLLQFMPGLVNLRALHTVDFRHEDTCVWVMREFRSFAVDAISHNPHMKLEYLALGLGVERLVRHIPTKADKGKGKAKANTLGPSKSIPDLIPVGMPASESAMAFLKMGVFGPVSGSSHESDDEDLRVGGKNGLIVETIGGIEFSDIPGVRIFEKDVLYGRL